MKPCIACRKIGNENPIFILNQAPASAQDIPDHKQVEQDCAIDLSLYQCPHCGLVQFDCEPVSYYRDVIRAGGYSTTMTQLRRTQYQHLIDTYQLEGKRFLEVGCGRGEFLQVLTEFPVIARGMEHKKELVAIAKEAGLDVSYDFTESKEQDLGGFDVFLSFNFLEHQPNPDVMLQAIYHNLTEDGMGLITVPSLEYILEQGSYYELIRDHIAYYSFDSFRNVLEQNGFLVLEEEVINRDTISAIVRKNPKWKLGQSATVKVQPISVDSMMTGFEVVTKEIEELCNRLKKEEKKLAIWGASHQGFTLAATTVIGTVAEHIIDSAPFKQGKFAPASHLPIVAPDDKMNQTIDAILIVAPGYTDEIAATIQQKFGKKVEVLTLRTSHLEYL